MTRSDDSPAESLTPEHLDCVLFDLGGVLVELRDPESASRWARQYLTQEQIDQLWNVSGIAEGYERGHCSTEAFVAHVIDTYDLPLSADYLTREFAAFILGVYPGAETMVDALRGQTRVACLSNTNDLHWRKMDEETGLLACFHDLFPSHQTGLLKPEPAAFTHVVESLDINPARILFLDDTAVNVEAAQDLGFQAVRTEGMDAVETVLRSAGFTV